MVSSKSASAVLVAHRGGRIVSDTELRRVKTPPPSGEWFPVGHARMVDMVKEHIGDMKHRVEHSAFALSADDQRFFGVFDLKPVKGSDVGMAIGVRSSTDQSMSQAMCFGSRVFVCDNLAFHSEVVFKTRNTTNVLQRLPRMIADSLNKVPQFQASQAEFFEKLKKVKITEDKTVHTAVVQAAKAGACQSRQITAIVEEWENPSFKEFKPRTAWSLFNAFTTVDRKVAAENPLLVSNRTLKLSGLFSDLWINNN